MAPQAENISPEFEAQVYRRVIWRLMPFLFLCYIFAYVDRVNVGFAKLSMQKDLGISDTAFSFGSGVFFVGYLLFQVPCNMMLQRIGARRWLGPIMIIWGLVSASTMFVRGNIDFYVLRFILGIVECGFFPGVIVYLTFWFTGKHRAQMVSIFMTAIPLSGFIFGPISGWLLNVMASVGPIKNWQWLFVIEAVPSILAGFATLFFLEDSPTKAKWLTDAEKALLSRRLEEDEALKKTVANNESSFAAALRKPAVWLFCLIYFGSVSGNYALQFWLPQIIKDTLTTDSFRIGLFSMIPWGVTTIVMVLVGRHSDKTGERTFHIATCVAAGGVGLALSVIPGIPGVLGLFALTIACAGVVSASSSFWSLPTLYLSGSAASAGIAMINSIGNLGGQFGPLAIGFIKDTFHSARLAMLILASFCWLSAFLTVKFFRHRPLKAASKA